MFLFFYFIILSTCCPYNEDILLNPAVSPSKRSDAESNDYFPIWQEMLSALLILKLLKGGRAVVKYLDLNLSKLSDNCFAKIIDAL